MGWYPTSEPQCEDARADEIELIIEGRPRDLGGFAVRRALPAAGRRLVGPFIFFDHMGPAVFAAGHGLDVRPHPHIGARDGDVPVRRRDHAPRQPRHRRSDPARRRELDDRPAAASCTRSAPRPSARARRLAAARDPELGRAAARARRDRRRASSITRRRRCRSSRARRRRRSRDRGQRVRAALAGAGALADALRRTRRSRPARECRSTHEHEQRAVYVVDGEIDVRRRGVRAGARGLATGRRPRSCARSGQRASC